MRSWVKLYTHILSDPKMHRLPDKLFRTCVNLFAIGGIIDRDGELGTAEDIAFHLRLDEKTTTEQLKNLAEINVTVTKNGIWSLKNWDKHQAKSPSSDREAVRKRVQKSRKNKAKNETSNDVTESLQNSLQNSLHDECNEPRLDKNRVEENREEKTTGADAPETKSPTPYAVASALAKVCKMDLEANKGQLLREASLLLKADPPATPELLAANYNGSDRCWWRSEDWRGKKNQDPTPKAIRETWGKWTPAPAAAPVRDPQTGTRRANWSNS